MPAEKPKAAPERRARSRSDDKTLDRLFELNSALSDRLHEHMQYEEERYRLIGEGITALKGGMDGLAGSMPQTGGKADLFRHRQHHELIEEGQATRKADTRTLRDKIISWIPYVLLLAVVTHGDKLLRALKVID